MKRIVVIGLSLLFAGVTAGWLAWSELLAWAGREHVVPVSVEVDLIRGESLREFSAELESRGVIDSAFRFQLFVRLRGGYGRFQAGHYRFEGAVRPQQIVADVRAGAVYRPIVFEVALPEGFTIDRLVSRLSELGYAGAAEVRRLAFDPNTALRLKVPSTTIEGFLAPATYPFTETPPPERLLETMVAEFWKRLPPGYVERVGERGLSLVEAVTFASLVELESAHPDERRMIAEVIWNRLARRMTLGIDAALIYGIPNYQGDITFAHLRDPSNPYNTRLRAGLPPTPIGSPSVDSLKAVLEPTSFGYLYYVAEPGGTGRHRFSKSAAEHSRGVSALLRERRRRVAP